MISHALKRSWVVALAAVLVGPLVSCGWSSDEHPKRERKERKEARKEKERAKEAGREDGPRAAPARDWNRYPAVVEMTTGEDVVAIGDVHGGYDRLVALLLSAGLIKREATQQVGYAWSGGRRVLVSVGDLIDKGDQSLPTLDLLMALEPGAASAGGRIVVTLGNHEAEFLADPKNKKAKREIDHELRAKGLDPEAVAAGQAPYGEWMRRRPLAAKINSWLFAHAGNTSGASTAALSASFRAAVDAGDWGAPVLLGNDSILEAQKWWKAGSLDADLAAAQVRHIVFGHDPGAFKLPGQITQRFDGKLFLIDVGMSPAVDYSKGALLVIHRKGAGEEAVAVDPSGRATPLWSGPG
jgi:calcineurin-like phosphoesterase family protein